MKPHPTIFFTDDLIIAGLQTWKLWVKTKSTRPYNQAIPTLKIPQSWKNVLFHICRVGLELFRNSSFGANFCFNSKPSFSFDSIGQKINFLLFLHIVATTKRIGLESKQEVSLPSYFRYAANEIPVSFPYRDTRKIRGSYRSFIGKISDSLWDWY